jgi:hypothetical protein
MWKTYRKSVAGQIDKFWETYSPVHPTHATLKISPFEKRGE